MRIGFNLLFLIPNEVGGSEVYVRGLLDGLRRMSPAPELILFTNRENHDTFPSFERVAIPVTAQARPKRILAEQLHLPRAARRAGVDLLFSPGYTAPFRSHCPQVVAIFDAQFLAVPEGFTRLSRAAQRILVGGAGRIATCVLTVSQFSRTELEQRLGIPPDRVHVTYPGIDPVFHQPQPSPVQSPYILSVSNTYPHKNYSRMVRAFDRIAGEVPHQLVIVGQARDGEPPFHPRVTRLDHVPRSALAGLMQGCDAFVLPSRYEGFGLPVAEAMAAGASLALSSAGAIPEVAGSWAEYFDPLSEESIAAALLKVLHLPAAERKRRADGAREASEHFTWERCAETAMAAFRRALNRD